MSTARAAKVNNSDRAIKHSMLILSITAVGEKESRAASGDALVVEQSRAARHPEMTVAGVQAHAQMRTEFVHLASISHHLPAPSTCSQRTVMEDGEIHEAASGAAYHPALEWQGDGSNPNSNWAEVSMTAGPSSASYAPPVHSSQAQVGDAHHLHAC